MTCPELLRRVKRADTGTHRVVGFRYSHGDEAIELQDGSRIEFRTRTKGGMRGFDDVSLLVLDEAMILAEHTHGVDDADPARVEGDARPAGLVRRSRRRIS